MTRNGTIWMCLLCFRGRVDSWSAASGRQFTHNAQANVMLPCVFYLSEFICETLGESYVRENKEKCKKKTNVLTTTTSGKD